MDIKDFEYGFRFTDENYALFSEEELSEMEVLSDEEAESLWSKYCDNEVIPLCSFAVEGEGLGDLSMVIPDCGWGDEEAEPKTTRLFQSVLEPGPDGCVYVCYLKNKALKVSAELFCNKWSDFCYPSDYWIVHFGERALLYYEDCVFFLEQRNEGA